MLELLVGGFLLRQHLVFLLELVKYFFTSKMTLWVELLVLLNLIHVFIREHGGPSTLMLLLDQTVHGLVEVLRFFWVLSSHWSLLFVILAERWFVSCHLFGIWYS